MSRNSAWYREPEVVETPLQEAPSDADIAKAARLALQKHTGTIYLSRLGQDLRQAFGPAFKAALGTRSLGSFVDEHLGDNYEVWGKGPYKRIGVLGSAATDVTPSPRKKYHDAVWEAFSTPVQEGCRRWITIGPPLSVTDAEEAPADSAVEIAPDLIIEDGRSHRERSDAIATSIQHWANMAGISSSSLEEERPQTIPSTPHQNQNASGTEALRRLIAAIPVEERAHYSLPMNLVGRLLQVP